MPFYIYIVAGIIFIATFLASNFALLHLNPSPISQRLQLLVKNNRHSEKGEEKRSVWIKTAEGIGDILTMHKAYTPGWLRKKLDMAGLHDSRAPVSFLGTIALVALLLGGLFFLLSFLAKRPFAIALLAGILGTTMGLILPNVLLTLKIARRQRRIISGLPNAIDFLVLCLEAGLSFNAAILKTAQEQDRINKSLSAEFLFTNQQIQRGKSRLEALRDLGERCGVEDLKALVTTMIQTEKLGMSASRNLRVQAKTLRIKRRQRVKEAISKAPVKMVFPLVFFIFPALFFVLLGPSVILLLRNFPGR